MGSFSDYAENKILNFVFNKVAFTQPTHLFLALSTANPGETGATIAEPVGNGYTRVMKDTWKAASNRAVSNSGVIEFPEATGPWGTITSWGLFDDSTAGNMIAYGDLLSAQAVNVGDNLSVQDGAINASFVTGVLTTYMANKILDHVFKTAAYTLPTNYYMALSVNSNPLDTGAGLVEPSGNAYARVQSDSWTTSTTGSLMNNGAITFPQATASWGTITHWAIIDASTSGNVLLYAPMTTARAVGRNDTPNFANNALVVSLN